MNTLPPPGPNDAGDSQPTEERPNSRRRLALAAAIATTLGIGGIAAGAQLANASTDETTTSSTDVESPDEQPSAEGDTDETNDSDVDDVDEGNDADGGEPTDDEPQAGTTDLDDFGVAFEEFEACLAEQLADVFGEDGPFGDATLFGDIPTSVTVYVDGEDGEPGEWTSLNLGEGDGSITITKTDGQVEVTSEGDVEEFNEADFDVRDDEFEAQWEERAGEFEAAHEACGDLLPDLPTIDIDMDLGDFGDLMPGDFHVDFEEFDLGDIDFDDFDFGDFGDIDFGDFGDIVVGDFGPNADDPGTDDPGTDDSGD